MNKYKYTEKCREISGFGGSYEERCRALVIAGLEWYDANPNAKPVFKTYEKVFGLILEENDDAKAMCKAMEKVSDDLTGAMMHAAHEHIRYARQNGWSKYIEEMETPSD